MKRIEPRLKNAFGIIVMCAILSSGCASPIGTAGQQAMQTADLRTFQPNCRIKNEQIAYLSSLLENAPDRGLARLQNFFMPWTMFTDPDGFEARQRIGDKYNDDMIRFNIALVHQACF